MCVYVKIISVGNDSKNSYQSSCNNTIYTAMIEHMYSIRMKLLHHLLLIFFFPFIDAENLKMDDPFDLDLDNAEVNFTLPDNFFRLLMNGTEEVNFSKPLIPPAIIYWGLRRMELDHYKWSEQWREQEYRKREEISWNWSRDVYANLGLDRSDLNWTYVDQ